MRISTVIGTFGMADPVAGVVAEAARAEADGLDGAWLTQGMGIDAQVTLALAAAATSRLALGVAVVPIQTRHALAMAQQAATVQLASGGRFTLGVGVSHKPVVEGVLGLPFIRPVEEMERYLDVLVPALAGEGAAVSAPPCPVLLAALGPRMLDLAGRRADGTVTWLTGRRTVRSHIAPTLRSAAERAGRPRPQVVVALPVCVTDDVDGARARADDRLQYTLAMPSYRAMLDREGAVGAGDISLVGDEAEVGSLLDDLQDAGVDELLALELSFPGEDGARTRALLAARAEHRG
jgi:5,10-methylenetetrahydromethanopterin reductase